MAKCASLIVNNGDIEVMLLLIGNNIFIIARLSGDSDDWVVLGNIMDTVPCEIADAAPRCPEVDECCFTLELCQFNLLAIDIDTIDGRRWARMGCVATLIGLYDDINGDQKCNVDQPFLDCFTGGAFQNVAIHL